MLFYNNNNNNFPSFLREKVYVFDTLQQITRVVWDVNKQYTYIILISFQTRTRTLSFVDTLQTDAVIITKWRRAYFQASKIILKK